MVAATGQMRTKAQRLAEIKQQTPEAAPVPREQETLRVYGGAAIERFRTGGYWVIQVWIKSDRDWQVVATQITPPSQ